MASSTAAAKGGAQMPSIWSTCPAPRGRVTWASMSAVIPSHVHAPRGAPRAAAAAAAAAPPHRVGERRTDSGRLRPDAATPRVCQ